MSVLRVPIPYLLLVFCISSAFAAERDANSGCMGVQSFSDWSRAKAFPYRATHDRQKEIRSGFKRVKLGFTFGNLKAAMPAPNWAIETERGCVWKYVIQMTDREHGNGYKGVKVRLTGQTVSEIGQEEGDFWDTVVH